MEELSILLQITPQQLVNGLTIGSVYALIAIGYTMVYGVLQLINFPHGDLFMLGAMIAVFLLAAIGVSAPLPVFALIVVLIGVFAVAMTAVGALGVLIERAAYKPLRNADRLSPLISALGVSLVIQNVTMNVVGPAPQFFPDIVPLVSIPFFGLVLNNKQLIVMAVAALVMVWLHYLVNRTRFGLAVRATAEDKDAAALMGIDINRVISMVFVVGPALGAAGGILFSMLYDVVLWNMGFNAGLKGFTAAVLGGIGNIKGAMLGGILLGVVEVIGSGYLPVITHGIIGPEYKDLFAYLILIAVLMFKPSGIRGEQSSR